MNTVLELIADVKESKSCRIEKGRLNLGELIEITKNENMSDLSLKDEMIQHAIEAVNVNDDRSNIYLFYAN